MSEGNKSTPKPELESLTSEQPQVEGEIRIIELGRSYLLSKEKLDLLPGGWYQKPDPNYNDPSFSEDRSRDTPGNANFQQFRHDLTRLVKSYAGTFVAYYGGVLCGQHSDGNLLYETARRLYGESPYTVRRLAVFKVPTEIPEIGKPCDLTKDAKGVF